MPFSRFAGSLNEAILLLRHDVDYNPEMALKIAEINAELGISGTFFFLMDSPLYNLCSDKSQQILVRLKELKQEIGWHVTFIPEDITKAKLLKKWGLFKKIVPWAEPLIAWHNPQKELFDKANAVAKTTGILKSVYSTPFISKKIKYLSDSNRRNGFNDLMSKLYPEVIPHVQLLLHPINWIVGGDDMKKILNGAWNSLLVDLDGEFSVNPNWKR